MKFSYTASYTTESSAYSRYSQGEGVHVYSISSDGLEWTEIQTVPEHDPAFIAFGKDRKTLYVAQSASNAALMGIVAYVVNKKTGKLEKLEQQIDFGRAICCLSVHPSGNYMVAADFKGNIYAIRLRQDGALDEITDQVALEGKLGPLANIQKCSRPHHIPFDLDGNYIIIPDKGYDLIHTYQLDTERGKFTCIGQAPIRPASCARHIAFHPDHKHLYVAAEYTSKIFVFDYDNITGSLAMRQVISAERSTYCGLYCKSSEISVHPNGRFLYVSNRGDNTIGVFQIDEKGLLTPVEWTETQGEIPRFFSMDEDGKSLYVGNQKSGNVAVFKVDSKTGKLTWTGKVIPVPCPTWILFSE